LKRIAVRSQGRVDYVAVADVIAARAAGNYVALVTEEGEHVHRTTLAALADTLAAAGFIRTHRSHLVHPRCIVSAKTRGGAIVAVTLANRAAAPVSEAYRADVAAMLDAALIGR
jgi:two-component system LytT family response regulator